MWYEPYQITYSKNDSTNEKEKIDDFIREMQLKIGGLYDTLFEWIPYDQFDDIKKIGKGGFATVYSAIWKDHRLYYDEDKREPHIMNLDKKVALKHLNNSQNIDEFLDEVKAYSNNNYDHVLKIHGISQNKITKDYVMILEYKEGGNFSNWINMNHEKLTWRFKLLALNNIITGLKSIHEKEMIHCDIHTGNILADFNGVYSDLCISDMGTCRKVGNTCEANIYGVMPYVAPEVLRGDPYTQASDIYSFGMIMYFVATEKQPFFNCAHDHILALNICNGVRPKINVLETPKCYIDLMERCWDPNPDNRPDAIELERSIVLFFDSYYSKGEIGEQFEIAEEYRKANVSSTTINNNQLNGSTNSQAIYTSRLLNPFTKNLLKSECFDCAIID